MKFHKILKFRDTQLRHGDDYAAGTYTNAWTTSLPTDGTSMTMIFENNFKKIQSHLEKILKIRDYTVAGIRIDKLAVDISLRRCVVLDWINRTFTCRF